LAKIIAPNGNGIKDERQCKKGGSDNDVIRHKKGMGQIDETLILLDNDTHYQ
jgi:hypothetical protein